MRSPLLSHDYVCLSLCTCQQNPMISECESVCVNQDINLSEYMSQWSSRNIPHTHHKTERAYSITYSNGVCASTHSDHRPHHCSHHIRPLCTLIFTGCVCLCVFNKGLSWEWWSIDEETLSRKGLKEIVHSKNENCVSFQPHVVLLFKGRQDHAAFFYIYSDRWPKTLYEVQQSGRFLVNNLWI